MQYSNMEGERDECGSGGSAEGGNSSDFHFEVIVGLNTYDMTMR